MTVLDSERIYPTVSRLKPFVAFLLLAAWGPSEFVWALALVALADGSHHVSLRSSDGQFELVLHHHPIPSSIDGTALDADDHRHADHVIRSPGTGRVLASRVARGDPPSQLCVRGDAGSRGVATDPTPPHVATFSPIGLSPPLQSIVLLI